MRKNWFLAAAMMVVLVSPMALSAHEGHAHKVMGTVSLRQANHVELKTPDGKTVMVMLDAKTTFARGKQKVDNTVVKVGERVVVEVLDEKTMTAKSVTLAAAAPAVAK